MQVTISWRFRPSQQFAGRGEQTLGLIQTLVLLRLWDAASVAQSVGHLTRKSDVVGSIPGLATYVRSSFRCFKRGSCQLLAEVCARSTG